LELRKGRTKQDKGAYDRTNYECLSTKIRNHRRKSISRIGISNIWSIALPYSSLENLGTKFILHDSKNRKKIFNKLHSTLHVIRFQTSTIHLRNNIMLYTWQVLYRLPKFWQINTVQWLNGIDNYLLLVVYSYDCFQPLVYSLTVSLNHYHQKLVCHQQKF